MNVELISDEVTSIEDQFQYAFVIDADLAQVGGGSTTVNY